MHLGLLRPRRFFDALVEERAAAEMLAGVVGDGEGAAAGLLLLRAGDEAAMFLRYAPFSEKFKGKVLERERDKSWFPFVLVRFRRFR